MMRQAVRIGRRGQRQDSALLPSGWPRLIAVSDSVHPAGASGYGTGFDVTTNALNGALECQGANSDKAKKRYEIYTKVAAAFGEVPLGPEGCYS